MPKNAVVLLHRGDPRTPEEVETFLKALYSDPGSTSLPFGQAVQVWLGGWIARIDAKSLKARLTAAGGRSAWHERIDTVAHEVEKLFNGDNQGTAAAEWIVRAAYTHRPEGLEALKQQLKAEGVTRAVGVSLYSHKATRRGGAVMQAFLKAFDDSSGVSVSVIERLSADPGYVDLIRAQLAAAPLAGQEATVVFAAPGVERADLDTGDDYRPNIEATAAAVVDKTSFKHAVAWLGEKMPGPLLPSVLQGLGKEGVKNVLLVPLGTTVDELGVVYALDVEAKEVAKEAGITRIDRAPQLCGEAGFAPLIHRVVNDHIMRVSALGLG